MKKSIFQLKTALFCLLSLAFVLPSCSDSDKEIVEAEIEETGSAPKVTLELVEVESTVITFNIEAENAEECAWMCITSDTKHPNTAEILEKGHTIDVSEPTSVVLDNLDPETNYVIMAAVKGNGKSVISNLLRARTKGDDQGSKDDFEGFMLDHVLTSIYQNDNIEANGNYVFSMANTEDFMLPNVGDIFVSIDFYAEPDPDPMNAALPSGIYKPGFAYEPFTYNPNSTRIVIHPNEEEEEDSEEGPNLVFLEVKDAEVEVEHLGMDYQITLVLPFDDGSSYSFRYKGPITFTEAVSDMMPRFDSNHENIVFDNVKFASYYGNDYYPHADDITLCFTQGTTNEHGVLLDGYELELPLFMEKIHHPEGQTIYLQEGQYTVMRKGVNQSHNCMPMSMWCGEYMEAFEELIETGTLLKHVDADLGLVEFDFVVDGVCEVKRSGNQYDITFDFITDKGFKATGSYSGVMDVLNQHTSYGDIPERPWTLLKSNKKLVFADDVVAKVFFMGAAVKDEVNSWALSLIGTEEEGSKDELMIEFVTPVDQKSIEGEYQVSRLHNPFQVIPGFTPYGGQGLRYSWYFDSTSRDEEGKLQVMAPIEEGTMSIQKEGENKYRFNFNFKDDAGHTIEGSWVGPIQITDGTKKPE